jgi:pimeloyl-ACP methyl ester carboxylesterase
MGAGSMEPLWDDLAHLTLPCTFVAGQLDHGYVSSARRLSATVPNSRVEIVPRAGHTVHQERPEAFARILAGHLTAATWDVRPPAPSRDLPAGDEWPSSPTSA